MTDEQGNQKATQLTYFGLAVIDGRFVRLDDIQALPFAAFWHESASGSTMPVSDGGETLVYLHDWVAFSELFIKTGQHRWSLQQAQRRGDSGSVDKD